jgi:hypothetical protein
MLTTIADEQIPKKNLRNPQIRLIRDADNECG